MACTLKCTIKACYFTILETNNSLFLVCYVCLDILPDFSYCTNPISTSFFFTAATNSKGCKCISSQHNCGWHHTSNALWKELENSPYNIRKNQEVEKVLYMFYSMALYKYISTT